MKKILIVNGVNLGQLGTREINIYGSESFDVFFQSLQAKYPQTALEYFQSESQSAIVEKLLSAKDFDGIVLNAGAYTHTSIVVADAVKAIQVPVIEVHISNLFAREQYRRNSMLASACCGFISGFGLQVYELAVLSFLLRKN